MLCENEKLDAIYNRQRRDFLDLPCPGLTPEEHVLLFLEHMTAPSLELHAAMTESGGDPALDLAYSVMCDVIHKLTHTWLARKEGGYDKEKRAAVEVGSVDSAVEADGGGEAGLGQALTEVAGGVE